MNILHSASHVNKGLSTDCKDYYFCEYNPIAQIIYKGGTKKG